MVFSDDLGSLDFSLFSFDQDDNYVSQDCIPVSFEELTTLLVEINQKYFSNITNFKIRWVDLPTRIWAQYCRRSKTIEISRIVKYFRSWQPKPPEFFLEYLIFHEILHEIHPSVRKNGRRYDHTSAFKNHERTYPGYEAIRDWENHWAVTRVSKNFLKFGTVEYFKAFTKFVGSSTNSKTSSFTLKKSFFKKRGWKQIPILLECPFTVLGFEPRSYKFPLQTKFSLPRGFDHNFTHNYLWIHPSEALWQPVK